MSEVIFIRVVTIIFLWSIVASILGIFEDYFMSRLKLWNSYRVEAEVTGLDTVVISRDSYEITILSYKKYDMAHKMYVRSSAKDKIGDKILIVTDGVLSARVHPYWQKDRGVVPAAAAMAVFLTGWILVEMYYAINMEVILTAIGVSFLYIVCYPLIYKYQYHSI